MAFIKIKNLKKEYHVTRTEKQEVLKGIDVEFARGEFVALLGESGCGKTTFLNILAGLDFDYTGSIVIKDEFIRDFTEKDLDNYRKQRVGVIFQSFNLIKQMTAFENVMLPLTLTELSPEERKARAEELIEKVGLSDHSHKYPNQLSGGQKQRIAIARALANNPSIILADEPTGNLDSVAADEIMELLKQIAIGGKLVVCVTHSAKVAASCTRVIKMVDGKIVEDKETKTYKTKMNEQDKPAKIKENIDKKEIFAFAKNNIKQSFRRSLLVSIALGIGICAFVLMLFLGEGLRGYVENEISTSMNPRQINVQKNATATGTFSSTEVDFLESLLSEDGVEKVIKASIITDFSVTYSGLTTPIMSSTKPLFSLATTYDQFYAELLYGRLPDNESTSSREIIISQAMANRLGITESNYAGKTITLTKDISQTFTIVGVINDDSSYDYGYITMASMNSIYSGSAPINLVYVMAKKVSDVSAILSTLEMLNELGDGYVAIRQDTTAEDVLGYIDMGTFVLAAISGISLIVSAIMIFIVMYISVIERTKEIGILRSLGTRRRDIKKIFMTEAGIVGAAAGVFGCVAAVVIGIIANVVTSGFNIMSINPLYISLGLVISFGVSILASLGPSGNASSLDPVESLRSE